MEQQINTWTIAKKYGLILGLVSFAYSLILKMLGLELSQIAGLFTYILLITAIVLAHKSYKSLGDGFMTFGKGLSVGTATGFISGIVIGILNFIYLTFIDKSQIEGLMDKLISEWENEGIEDEQIDFLSNIFSYFLNPTGLAVLSIIGGIIGAFIFSLVISAFTKNENPELEF